MNLASQVYKKRLQAKTKEHVDKFKRQVNDIRKRVKFPMAYLIQRADEMKAALARGDGPDPGKLYVHPL